MGAKGQAQQGRWRDQWWAVGLLVLVIGVAVRLAFRGWSAWPEALVGGVFYAGFLTWFLMRRRRRDAEAVGTEPDRVPELERRIAKNGELPDDPAEQEAMVRLIRRREEKLRRSRRWAFPMLGVIFLGTPLLWFTSGDVAGGAVDARLRRGVHELDDLVQPALRAAHGRDAAADRRCRWRRRRRWDRGCRRARVASPDDV